MIFFSAIREYWFADGREASASVASSQGDGQDDGQLPIAGYSGLDRRELMAELPKHSQVELTAVDAYERSHKNRSAVLDKLRYLRGPEPLSGYDALGDKLGGKEVLEALAGADLATLHKTQTRTYERKFQHRPDVLNELDRLREKQKA